MPGGADGNALGAGQRAGSAGASTVISFPAGLNSTIRLLPRSATHTSPPRPAATPNGSVSRPFPVPPAARTKTSRCPAGDDAAEACVPDDGAAAT